MTPIKEEDLMEHKAFVFDINGFNEKLSALIIEAGLREDTVQLEEFIDHNLGVICSPYTGELLDNNWRSELENGDVQEVADFCMTCFYNPQDDMGLSYSWDAVLQVLKTLKTKLPSEYYILGNPLKQDNFVLDPGRMGTGFVKAEDIPIIYRDVKELKEEFKKNPASFQGIVAVYHMSFEEILKSYEEVINIYEKAHKANRGLLFTF